MKYLGLVILFIVIVITFIGFGLQYVNSSDKKVSNKRPDWRVLTYDIQNVLDDCFYKLTTQHPDTKLKLISCGNGAYYIYYLPRKIPGLHPHIHYNSTFAGFPGGDENRILKGYTNDDAYIRFLAWKKHIHNMDITREELDEWDMFFDIILTSCSVSNDDYIVRIDQTHVG
jgi:hypothetical protein